MAARDVLLVEDDVTLVGVVEVEFKQEVAGDGGIEGKLEKEGEKAGSEDKVSVEVERCMQACEGSIEVDTTSEPECSGEQVVLGEVEEPQGNVDIGDTPCFLDAHPEMLRSSTERSWTPRTRGHLTGGQGPLVGLEVSAPSLLDVIPLRVLIRLMDLSRMLVAPSTSLPLSS